MRRVVLFAVLATWVSVHALPAAAAVYHVNPERGDMASDGSKSAPWSTLAEVVASGRLGRVQPGDTLLLHDGFHGDVRFSGDNEEVVTIAAAPGQKPRLSRLTIGSGSKWTVRGLIVSPSFGEEGYGGSIVSIGEQGPSSDLVVEDCFVHTALDTSAWTVADWMKANHGIWLGRHGARLTARNNYVMNVRFGIDLCAPESLCEGNVVANFSADAIRVTRDDLLVQYNVIRNVYCDAAAGDANHDDAIQCFLFNKGRGTVRRGTIRGNLVVNREDDAQRFTNTLQGIGFFDGPVVEFLVEKNVILTSHWHGVSLFDAQDCRILDNAVYTRWRDVRLRPWVMLGQKIGQARGNTVKGNLAHSFDFEADASVDASGNKTVDKRVFYRRFAKLRALIDEKFGRIHPTAERPRLERPLPRD